MTTEMDIDQPDSPPPAPGPALIFGISGEQGREVARGLVAAGYSPIYGVTSSLDHVAGNDKDASIAPLPSDLIGSIRILEVNLSSPAEIRQTLTATAATSIFLVTTTDLPPDDSAMGSLKESEELEYDAIVSFFDTLVALYNSDNIPRHVIFSTLDDVETIWRDDQQLDVPALPIQPLDDGSIVPHYSGKGRAGSYALQLLESIPDLAITLLTLPFLHSNFLASAIPLPNDGKTQWTIGACLGDAAIDMFSASDLAYIVPKISEGREIYDGYNVKLSAEKITMEEVAEIYADLFGKDVIYNPLTPEEMSAMPIPGADAWAQMCQFLASPYSSHDIGVTETVLFPRKPQLFKDWLLTHSDHASFEKVGLSVDVPEITKVTVFGATGMQGTSVVKGLLADKRKDYQIRATTRDVNSKKAQAIKALDPDRITLVQADFDDIESCEEAANGSEGAFLVTDFYSAGMDPKVEEQHARNVIDACEASHTIRHLIFSTLESVEDMNKELKLGLEQIGEPGDPLSQFDAKARAAAYTRTKKISVTYVLMPIYSESFFKLLAPEEEVDENTGETKRVMNVPEGPEGEAPVMCMSVEELGPAVANIFDSYECYAGHEIGLVTEFVTMSEAAEMIKDVFFKEEDLEHHVKETKVEKKDITKDSWIEKKDTFAKDLGQIFRYLNQTDAVRKRRSVAKTLDLVPDARPMRQWLEENRDNVEFRQMLGLR